MFDTVLFCIKALKRCLLLVLCGDVVGLALAVLNPVLRDQLLDIDTCLRCYERTRITFAKDEVSRKRLLELLERCRTRTELFVESFAVLYGDTDPYLGTRERLNNAVLNALKDLVDDLKDPAKGVEILAKANAVDVSMPWYEFDASSYLDELHRVGVEVRGFDESRLVNAKSVAIVLDNAGEAVLDVAFAMLLAIKGIDVWILTRSQPYEVDVVYDEVVELVKRVGKVLGIDARIRVLGTGSRYQPPAKPYVSSDVIKVMERADLVISKGVGNFKAFLEYRPIDLGKVLFLLKAKCPPMARFLGIEMGRAIASMGIA